MHTSKHFESNSRTRPLPQPQRERWQPLRSGFVNLYRYDQEEFHWENGRLLLRGNNGTGKSRILALQLPFLLDGEVIPQRLEPDADPAKRVEWNLLMGRYPERTGYTWIEFGRRDEHGEEHYVTLGCGLSAVEDQNGVRQWFFISKERIGKDLKLVSEAGQALGKDRLRERIGASGQVFESVGPYRSAVNDALFHLDDYRYSSLVNLLIQLRRPQLTRRLDEDELSGALSEALPPVSSTVISGVAEAFRSLESDRNSLESFHTAASSVEQFLTRYQSYAQVAAKRRADRVLTAQREYEAQMKDILASEADCNRSLAELASFKAEIQHFSAEQHELEAEINTLQQSSVMRNAPALERSQIEAKDRRQEAELAATELAAAVQARKTRGEEHVRAMAAFEQHEARLTAATNTAAQAAASAGLESAHRDFISSLNAKGASQETSWKIARERIEAAVQVQTDRVSHVRRLNERIAVAKIGLQQSTALKEQLSGLLDDARERLNAAQHDHSSAIRSFLGAADDWRANLVELRLPFEDAFLGAVTDWCESPHLFNPFGTAVRKGVEELLQKFAEQRIELRQLQHNEATRLNELNQRRERLASGDYIFALGPDKRTAALLDSRAGAPLWLLCDFTEGLDPAAQAGLEASLEGAGFLDAWITPSGELLDSETHELVLSTAGSSLPPEDAHLGMLLVPSTDPPETHGQVPHFVVADILRHIGAKPNAGNTWMSTEGRWQNGPMIGYSTKPAAEYIGEAAREMTRLRRIQELETPISEAQERFDSHSAWSDELHRRESVVHKEADAAPSDERVRSAYEQAMAVAREVDALRSRLTKADEFRNQKRFELDEATEDRDRGAMDLNIAKWIDSLDALEHGISGYRAALSTFWLTMEAFLDAQRAIETAWARVEEAKAREHRQHDIAGRLKRAAIGAEIRFDKMRQAFGSSIDETLHMLADARQRYDESRKQADEVESRHHETELAVTRLDERLRNLTETLNGHIDRREGAASSLRAFAATRLLHVAVDGITDEDAPTWSVARTVEVARELAAKLDGIESSDPVWENHQKSVPVHFNELMQTLSAHDCQPTATFRDDVFVASALFANQECTMEDLRQILSNEVTAREILLNAREKEILENHLVGEVSSHLHNLLNAAEEQVQQMNLELESRPMSTGMKLRLVWRPIVDGLLGVSEVRQQLLRSEATWSLAERQALGAFLQQQIRAARSQTEGGTWQESLVEALDYRRWHRFGVERYQDGVWKRLTRRTHGTGSGGEKAVALTLPHFAAAAAFYRTAHTLAPRLILLDEAFVGIDADMRAKCMGLIHTFDLDFMMTSEREWGCYRTLPGIAIYQLSTRPGIDAIGLTRWVWNGRQRTLNQNIAGEDVASIAVPNRVVVQEES